MTRLLGRKINLELTIFTILQFYLDVYYWYNQYRAQAIARNWPDLVVRFSMLKDEPNGSSPFSIGSVNGDAPPTDIEATITYKTPYIIRGQPVVVTFALSKTIATNSILSFPFLQSIKAALLLENMTCISAVLGDTFKSEYMVPL